MVWSTFGMVWATFCNGLVYFWRRLVYFWQGLVHFLPWPGLLLAWSGLLLAWSGLLFAMALFTVGLLLARSGRLVIMVWFPFGLIRCTLGMIPLFSLPWSGLLLRNSDLFFGMVSFTLTMLWFTFGMARLSFCRGLADASRGLVCLLLWSCLLLECSSLLVAMVWLVWHGSGRIYDFQLKPWLSVHHCMCWGVFLLTTFEIKNQHV